MKEGSSFDCCMLTILVVIGLSLVGGYALNSAFSRITKLEGMICEVRECSRVNGQ